MISGTKTVFLPFVDFRYQTYLMISLLSGSANLDTPTAGTVVLSAASQESDSLICSVPANVILFVFSSETLEGIKCSFDTELYSKGSGEFLLIAHPMKDWTIDFDLKDGTLQLVGIGIQELHAMLGDIPLDDPDAMKRAAASYRSENFVTSKVENPSVRSVIHQLCNNRHTELPRKLFQKSKVMEFLSLFMSQSQEAANQSACPYLTNDADKEKMQTAHAILLEEMASPPTIPELAKRVGTNELKLKMGFKHLYNHTIHGFVRDRRMATAKEMLDSTHKLPIGAIAESVGYSNPSHFISEFKTEFGVTPKQYLKG